VYRSRFQPIPPGPLSARIIVLAETPEDASIVDDILRTIGPLAADLVEPARYASVTSYRTGAPLTTVSTSSDIAIAVDCAQYADDAGPCVDAVRTSRTVHLSELPSTMEWPGFRDVAVSLGLRSSLSIPLLAASGRSVASLNLYSHDADAFTTLADRVDLLDKYGDDGDEGQPEETLDPGSEQLIAGLAEAAFIIRIIKRAVGVVMQREHVPPTEAYVLLRIRAAEIGQPLTETALAVARGERSA
jgi:hypothetical protein